MAKYERMMREDPKSYWLPQNQIADRDAIERSVVEFPLVPPGPSTPVQPALDCDAASAPAAPPGANLTERSQPWQSVTVENARE